MNAQSAALLTTQDDVSMLSATRRNKHLIAALERSAVDDGDGGGYMSLEHLLGDGMKSKAELLAELEQVRWKPPRL